MTRDPAAAQRLLAALPDVPRWMETRSILMSEDCDLHVFREDPPAFVARDPITQLVCVGGRPPATAISNAVQRDRHCDVLVQTEDRANAEAALPGWPSTLAQLHLLADEAALKSFPPGDVRVFRRTDLDRLANIPHDLRDELERTLLRFLAVAAYTESGEVASICLAGAPTETLWDIGIDTLEPHRRQGYATQAVRHMVDLMWEQRRRPVWGALETNEPSLALAKKLGFRPVETMVVIQSPH